VGLRPEILSGLLPCHNHRNRALRTFRPIAFTDLTTKQPEQQITLGYGNAGACRELCHAVGAGSVRVPDWRSSDCRSPDCRSAASIAKAPTAALPGTTGCLTESGEPPCEHVSVGQVANLRRIGNPPSDVRSEPRGARWASLRRITNPPVAVGMPVCPAPPAQIRASAPNAHGSYLGCFDAKRTSGYGCRILTSGIRCPSLS